ncbi:MAG: hypothetical protein ACRDOY_04540 [Nocardioidaceae bacterium]
MKLNLRQSGSWIGLSGMFCVLWVYGASGLVGPNWLPVAFVAVWVVLFVLACRWFRTRPYVVLALPVGALVLWFVVVTLGAAFLGWTA